jgi:hypothetical protein
MNPGGGSTPSSISRARCIRARSSKSSIGNSSGLNLSDGANELHVTNVRKIYVKPSEDTRKA